MQYKTELHAHTSEVSPCADLPARDVVEYYISQGYSSLVIANHFCDYVIDNAGVTWEQKIDHYLSGYRAAKEAAKGRINVLLGCELRVTQYFANDFLLFGVTEDFLYSHPDLHRNRLSSVKPYLIDAGILIVQAHPFRKGMTVVPPEYLNGIEVFNGHPEQISRNDFADLWAKKYGLFRTSGSDFHGSKFLASGGILTDEPITSEEQLKETVRTGNCTLICRGPAAERDGMSDMPAKY